MLHRLFNTISSSVEMMLLILPNDNNAQSLQPSVPLEKSQMRERCLAIIKKKEDPYLKIQLNNLNKMK